MSLDETNKIEATFILEVLGRPPEHLNETLKEIIENKMKKEKGVIVKDYKIHEPVLMKDSKDFYTNFAEIELEMDSILKLMFMVFGYSPAHIEVIYPEKIKLSNDDVGTMLNELARKLHKYDEIVRMVQTEKKVLENKMKSLLEEKNSETKDSDSEIKKE